MFKLNDNAWIYSLFCHSIYLRGEGGAYKYFGHSGSRSVPEHFSTSGNSAGLPGPAKNVLPTYRSKSTQNVLEAAQIKRYSNLANVLKVIKFEEIYIYIFYFSSEMHCVCVCVRVCLTRYFMLKCDVIQCSRKRTLSTYAFGDWVGSQIYVFLTRWYH